MQDFFGYLFLLSGLFFIVGMFKPSIVIRWGEVRNRKKVLLVYGISTFVFMMLTGATAPNLSPEEKQAKQALAQQQAATKDAAKQKSDEANKKEMADKAARVEADKKAAAEKAAKEQAERNKPKLEVIEHHAENDSYNGYIVGTVRNNTNKNYSYVQVSINLYDDSGVQVGSTLANVNNLEPNGQWKFKAIILESSTKKYQIKEVTGW